MNEMNVYKEAHTKIDRLPEESVYLIIRFMDMIGGKTAQKAEKEAGKLDYFFDLAGNIDIDDEAVSQLRNASMI